MRQLLEVVFWCAMFVGITAAIRLFSAGLTVLVFFAVDKYRKRRLDDDSQV